LPDLFIFRIFIFALVKQFLGILLMLLVAGGAIVPCCTTDDCNLTARNHNHTGQNEDKGNCSPFFACGTCAQAIESISPSLAAKAPLAIQPQRHSFYLSCLSNYHASFFQPPKLT
jgi:hypothetical protein